jgi:hypothetical protein
MSPRNGSHALTDAVGLASFFPQTLGSTPNPVVTSLSGFAWPFPSWKGGLGSSLIAVSWTASDPVVIPLAGFAGGLRPHASGGRAAMPAAFG